MSFLDRLASAFSGNRFTNAFMAQLISDKVNEWMEEGISPEQLDYLIEKDIMIYEVLTKEQILDYKKRISDNAPLVLLVLHEHLQFVLDHLLPQFVNVRIRHGEKGDMWLDKQLDWVEGMATNRPSMQVKSRWQ